MALVEAAPPGALDVGVWWMTNLQIVECNHISVIVSFLFDAYRNKS